MSAGRWVEGVDGYPRLDRADPQDLSRCKKEAEEGREEVKRNTPQKLLGELYTRGFEQQEAGLGRGDAEDRVVLGVLVWAGFFAWLPLRGGKRLENC